MICTYSSSRKVGREQTFLEDIGYERWSGLNLFSWGPVEGFCGHDNEPVKFVVLIAITEDHCLLGCDAMQSERTS
jgi:hypothetical protein